MLRYQTHSPDEAFRAFNELYSRYSKRVYSYLSSKLSNAYDRDDLLQKVFIKVHDSKHLYKNTYKFEQWLFVIAKTQILDHFRSAKRYKERLNNAEESLGQALQEKGNLREDFLTFINSDQLEMLEMKYIDDLSYQEMSAILGKSDVSLRKSLSRLIGKLRKGEIYE